MIDRESPMSQLDDVRAYGPAQSVVPDAKPQVAPSHVPVADVPDGSTESDRYDPAGWPDGEPFGPREIWEPLPGWPHVVSNVGGRTRSAAGKILSQRDSNRPIGGPPFYQLQTLCCGPKKMTVTVHRCVLLAHRGEPQEGEEGSHLDDVPNHNSLANLIWERHPENEQRKPPAARSASASTARQAQLSQRESQRVIEQVSTSRLRRALRWLRGHRG